MTQLNNKKKTLTKKSLTVVKASKKTLLNAKACRKYHGTHFDKKKPLQDGSKPFLACDWLQFWAKIKSLNLKHEKLGSQITNFLNREKLKNINCEFVEKHFNGDPMFHNHAEFWNKDIQPLRPLIYISYQPKLNLPHDYVMIKIDNWALYNYRTDLIAFINEIELLLGIEFYRLSRLDICLDFQHFANKLHPQNFINNFHQHKYIKRYACSYTCTGKAQLNKKDHYIRFGSKSQPVQWYLYNKSKELREKSDKPWIRELWQPILKLKQDVWRLEFSIKPSNLVAEIKDKDGILQGTAQYGKHTLALSNLEIFFDDLFYHHCDFRINNGTKRKDRMNRVNLFKHIHFNEVVKVKPKDASNRMDKIFIGMLERLNISWRKQNDYDPTVTTLIRELLDSKDLHEWFQDKFLNNIPDVDTTNQTTQNQPNIEAPKFDISLFD